MFQPAIWTMVLDHLCILIGAGKDLCAAKMDPFEDNLMLTSLTILSKMPPLLKPLPHILPQVQLLILIPLFSAEACTIDAIEFHTILRFWFSLSR